MSESCDPRTLSLPANEVLENDLETLRTIYTEEERVEMWNKVRSGFKEVIKCSSRLEPEVRKKLRGKYLLAMLMLAASFKLNNEGQGLIIKMFSDEEYSIFLDFEELKIFDALDVDTIVEFIKRREGKVYELVRKYYDKQYNVLDRAWGHLKKDLLYGLEERYSARRRKIEEAVIRYVKRYGLIETVSEIEEAVKKVLEAGEFRRKIEKEVRERVLKEYRVDELRTKLALLEEERARLYERLSSLEEKALSGSKEVAELTTELNRLMSEKEELTRRYGEALQKLKSLQDELTKIRELLRVKEDELTKLKEKYKGNAGAVEALSAEAEALRSTLEKIRKEAEHYKRLTEMLTHEKEVLKKRLEEVQAALRGEIKGRLVTLEEAEGFCETYLRRVGYKLRSGRIRVYDPRVSGSVNISKWDDIVQYDVKESELRLSRGVMYIKKRGLIFKSKDIVVEIVYLAHDEVFKEKGFDTKPVTLAEVLSILRKRVEEAEAKNYYHILVIASPTGFTEKAKEYVASDEFHRNFVARNLTLYLVDPVSGEVLRNPADLAAEFNSYIVMPETPEDLVKKVIDYVLNEETILNAIALSPSEPMVLVDKLSDELGVPLQVVRVALERLKAEGWGDIMYLPKEGIIAFKYGDKAKRAVGRG